MKKTFQSEDKRKDKLFIAWNQYLAFVVDEKFKNLQEDLSEFERTYEGLVKISYITSDSMNLELESGEKINGVSISKEIVKSAETTDMMYVVLGKQGDKWWPLNVFSIGNQIDDRQLHLSVNPLIMLAYQADQLNSLLQNISKKHARSGRFERSAPLH